MDYTNQMTTLYWRRANIIINPQDDGSVKLSWPREESPTVSLDLMLFKIWAASDHRAVAEIAEITQISTYLVSGSLKVLQQIGLILADNGLEFKPIPQNILIIDINKVRELCQSGVGILDFGLAEQSKIQNPQSKIEITPTLALPRKTWQVLNQRGIGGTIREIRQYIRWRLRR